MEKTTIPSFKWKLGETSLFCKEVKLQQVFEELQLTWEASRNQLPRAETKT